MISARGAAVTIPFTFSCAADHLGEVSLSLVEALGNKFASGYGSRNITCTGDPQSVELYVQADTRTEARPFKPGPDQSEFHGAITLR